MTDCLNGVCDHVLHVEVHIDQVKVIGDHKAFLFNGDRIFHGSPLGPFRIRGIADLHAGDGLGDLCHLLDQRHLKVKARRLLDRRLSEGGDHSHLFL